MELQSAYDGHLAGIVAFAMRDVRARFAESDPPVVHHLLYGAVSEDPGLLSVFFLFEDDAALEWARRQRVLTRIRQVLLGVLTEEGYPVECLSPDQISFGSEEEILISDGPWPFYR